MLINSDTTIKDVVDKDITVTDSAKLTIRGICPKTVHLTNGSTLVCYGMCGNLIIDSGSHALIHGTVKKVTNNGAVTVYGVVKNLIDNSDRAEIHQNAIVNKN